MSFLEVVGTIAVWLFFLWASCLGVFLVFGGMRNGDDGAGMYQGFGLAVYWGCFYVAATMIYLIAT